MEQRKNKLFEHIPHPHVIQNANHLHKMEQSVSGFNDKLAVFITNRFGTIWAFYALIAWMFIWMILATSGIWLFANDRYPFPFLLFCSNLIQLWALPVLAFGQQVLSRKAEIQNNVQFQDIENSSHDIKQIALHLDKQDDVILEILRRLEGGNNSESNAKQEAASAITAPFNAINPGNVQQP